MSVLNFSLLRIFQGYLVICCLIINVLCFCCLTTAILDYHISFRLSTTFFTFLNFYFFCFYRSIKCSDIIPCFLFVCQHLFSTFFKFLYQHFTFPENKRRRRDLNPRTAINDLLPFQGSPFSHLGTSPKCPRIIHAILFSLIPRLSSYASIFSVVHAHFQGKQKEVHSILNFPSGEGGIRTHAPSRTNGFQDRLVMTTSIPLQTSCHFTG